ncbi:MFS transporter [Algibacter lectus]|uniref:MFS permease n=1 Tax=Algibacter lectus TaxID=221126 RepID=A0A090WT93_9FLAO|nr:MFS transporter [Algibacter lectus]MWW24351.1 MFS transporter [Algibacter lectus]TDY62370.1 putative MFS family arabinose efflux permease [Algibacter lectus]GAL60599.1 MFS permease [Algibacter lectus]GAL78579.1 MFS permease [Algibacter lectus]
MAKTDPYAALRIKEFNIFLLVRFLLVFGWSMQFIVIEWQVYSLTKDPLSLGIIGLMEIIPAFTMALFAGHIVDQKEKRNLLATCIAAFSLISFGLFMLTWDKIVGEWSSKSILYSIYALVFFGGFLRSFFGPTIFSLVALIVPKKVYPNAATWNSSTWQMAGVLGPALGGFTIGWIGVHWSLCIIFGLILMSFFILLQIKRKPILNPKIGEPVIDSLKEGLRFVFKTKAVLGAMTLDMVAVLFGGAIALLPVFAQDILKVGSEGFGVLRAAPAVGAFLTMLITAYIPISKNAGMKLLVAIFGFGVCIIVFGLSNIFWISAIALFFSGMTDGVSMVIRQTIFQIKTPDHMRGRVSSVNSMFVGSSNELGAFESGVTAKFFGAVTAVVFGGTMTLITVVATGLASPSFRKLDLTEDLKAHESDD